MPESLAYVVPQSQKRGDMHLIPNGKTHAYRLGEYGPSEIDYGLYDIEYEVFGASRGNRTYNIYYINEADRTVPENYHVLQAALESITGFADKILARIGQDEDMESVFRRLKDQSWLEEIHGIGPTRSESLVEKFESIIPEGLEVFAAFRQHGLPYTRSNQREEWAYAYFKKYPEELETFKQNPYHLVRIGNASKRDVRNLQRERPDLNAASYPISWIDERVEGWEKSHERIVAFLETSLSTIFNQGHTVATHKQIAEALRRRDLDYVEYLDESGQLQQKRTDHHLVDAMVGDTQSTQRVSFTDPDGRKYEGVTSDSYRHRARKIANTVTWLGNKGSPFSEREAERMIGWANQTAPVELDQSQQTAIRYAFHSSISAVAGAAGTGKGLSLDTPLPTPEGWTTVGDLEEGDQLFDENGDVCTVTFVTEKQYRNCYEVEFDDSTVIVTDDVHRWKTNTVSSRRSKRNKRNRPVKPHGTDQSHKHYSASVRTTEEIKNSLRAEGRNNHSIPTADPLQLPEKDFQIPPYVLGVWLGDGNKNGGRITIGEEDLEELIGLLKAEGETGIEFRERRSGVYEVAIHRPQPECCKRGHEYDTIDQGNRRCSTCQNQAARARRNNDPSIRDPKTNLSLRTRLREIGVLGDKHIPECYLRASQSQRLSLLQGIVDTDGHISERQGSVEISFSNRQLAQDLRKLIASLGIKYGSGSSPTQGKRRYRTWLTTSQKVAQLERKVKNLPEETRPTQNRRYITDVREVDTVATKCLQVNSDSHLFLAGETHVPTHNTTTLGSILSGCAPLLEARESQTALGDTNRRTAYCVYVTAPTGKATQRARQELDIKNPETGKTVQPGPVDPDKMPDEQRFIDRGNIQVGTLHSMLGFRGHSFDLPAPHPSVIVVDESSMMDLELAYNLMQYVHRCLESNIPVWVLLSGDIQQLPPVGAGYPYRDFLVRASGPTVPSTKLDRIHRQDEGSGIVEAAFRLANGEMPPVPSESPGDFFWHRPPEGKVDPWEYVQSVAERAQEQGTSVKPEDVQLILPLRHPSSVDEDALCMTESNQRLQKIFAEKRGAELQTLTACRPEDPESTWGVKLAEGDRVVHNGRNRYWGHSQELEPINRGTIGRVERIEDGVVTVNYDTCPELVTYSEPEDRGQLGLAYAMTCHVAQGSEFPVTAVALPKRGAPTLMTRSWLITALTRASEFCDLMGTEERVQKCATENKAAWRQTNLSQM